MNNIEIGKGFATYNAILPEENQYPINKLDERVGNCAHFLHQTKTLQPAIRLVANRPKDSINERSTHAPHSREEIDRTHQASREAKEEAHQHTINAWEALGNIDAGTVFKESIEGVKSLRESEKLEKEAIRLENENIDHYQNGRK